MKNKKIYKLKVEYRTIIKVDSFIYIRSGLKHREDQAWKDVVKIHLRNFPTVGEYKKEMGGIIDNLSFVEKMYTWLDGSRLNKLGEMDLNFDEDKEYITPIKNHRNYNEIIFCFGKIEDRIAEDEYDISGVSAEFTYSSSNECFIDFRYEQWQKQIPRSEPVYKAW